MNRPKKWTIIVDPDKRTEIGLIVGFIKNGVLISSKVYVDKENKRIYVDTPIEKTSVRQRVIQLAERY